MAGAALSSGCDAPPLRVRPELLGFNLITWDSKAMMRAAPWLDTIKILRTLGVPRVTLVPYRILNDKTRQLVSKSAYGLIEGPPPPILAEIMAAARSHGLSVGLKPMIEIDNPEGEGVIWRGTIRLNDATRSAFFSSYKGYVFELLRVALANGVDRFYIGSELSGVAMDPTCTPFWLDLIRACRREIGGGSCILSYAANYDEYQNVPFWGALDEIGIDAYFPLARAREAVGRGRPSVDLLQRRLVRIMEDIHAVSRRHNRPIMLAEWGVVPFDLTSTEPSSVEPSLEPDPEEALNAYKAVLNVVNGQGPWLTGIDFWHWSVSRRNDSAYAVTADSQVARLVRSALMS